MRNSGFLWVIIILFLLLDLYIFQALKVITANSAARIRTLVYTLYWTVSVISLGALIALPYLQFNNLPKGVRTYFLAIIIGLFFSKLIASLFFGIDDLRRGVTWIASRFTSASAKSDGEGISRSVFLSWLGLGVGSAVLGTFIYGFTNKYNYQLNRVKLAFSNLPDSFRGLKIAHISDLHVGSFMNREAVQKGIEKILDTQPDMILFTGDMVNDHAAEMDRYADLFATLKAPLGVYSILGNHDYGLYALPRDLNDEERALKINENVDRLKAVHQTLGWRLLMNEHVSIERNGESIALMGVENWSMKGNFPKFGQLSKAFEGTSAYPFRILLTHDPSHWDGEVLPKYSSIDLTLSGHTHGMQFGVETPSFKWSPVQYMYNRWAGLYTEGSQRLYINRGFGFIGYPGRVGILPEITLIELT